MGWISGPGFFSIKAEGVFYRVLACLAVFKRVLACFLRVVLAPKHAFPFSEGRDMGDL